MQRNFELLFFVHIFNVFCSFLSGAQPLLFIIFVVVQSHEIRLCVFAPSLPTFLHISLFSLENMEIRATKYRRINHKSCVF